MLQNYHHRWQYFGTLPHSYWHTACAYNRPHSDAICPAERAAGMRRLDHIPLAATYKHQVMEFNCEVARQFCDEVTTTTTTTAAATTAVQQQQFSSSSSAGAVQRQQFSSSSTAAPVPQHQFSSTSSATVQQQVRSSSAVEQLS
jgi:hypothetical protein